MPRWASSRAERRAFAASGSSIKIGSAARQYGPGFGCSRAVRAPTVAARVADLKEELDATVCRGNDAPSDHTRSPRPGCRRRTRCKRAGRGCESGAAGESRLDLLPAAAVQPERPLRAAWAVRGY